MQKNAFPVRDRFSRPPCRPTRTDELCELLRCGHVLQCGLIPWGSNYTFLATIDVGQGMPMLGVYKPRRGEAPLWDFPDGTLYKARARRLCPQ